jgi:hypothetical protein
MLSAGQVHDLQLAADLIENEHTGVVVADKAYDSDVLLISLSGQELRQSFHQKLTG